MKENVCPFCGADIRFQCCRLSSLVGIIEIEYFCGTLKDTDGYHQSGECKDRQIAALKDVLEQCLEYIGIEHEFGDRIVTVLGER